MTAVRISNEFVSATVELTAVLGVFVGATVAVFFIFRLRRVQGRLSFAVGLLSVAAIVVGSLTPLFSSILIPGKTASRVAFGYIVGLGRTQLILRNGDSSFTLVESYTGTAWEAGMELPTLSAAGLAAVTPLILTTGSGLINEVLWIVWGASLSGIMPFVGGEAAGRLLPPNTSFKLTMRQFTVSQVLLIIPVVSVPYLSRWYHLFTYPPRSVDIGGGIFIGLFSVLIPVLIIKNKDYIEQYILLRP